MNKYLEKISFHKCLHSDISYYQSISFNTYLYQKLIKKEKILAEKCGKDNKLLNDIKKFEI